MIDLANIFLTSAFASLEMATGFFLGQRYAKKIVHKSLQKQYEKIVSERMAEIQGDFDRVLKAHEEDFMWIEFQKKDFARHMRGNQSAARKLAEAISSGAGLKARNSILQESLEAAQQEIAQLKTARDEDHNIRLPAQESVSDNMAINGQEIVDGRVVLLEAEIRKLNTRLQAAESETRALRMKNMKLSGLIREEKTNAGEPNADTLTGDQEVKAVIEPIVPGSMENGSDDTSVLWKLNGELTTIPIPKTLTELKPWVDTYLADKVILTPKALRAAEKARNYQDIALVYKALLLLGARRNMIVEGGMEHKKYFEEQLSVLHLECATAIRASGLGRIKNGQYRAEWNGQKFQTTMAIKRDNARDPKRVLRVYFADNKPGRNIIVGHLPTHLDNRFS